MSTVADASAAQAVYWAFAGPDKPGGGPYSVGYSQPDRLDVYAASDEIGRLTRDTNADCGTLVMGAINYGLHKTYPRLVWGHPVLFDLDDYWTGNLRGGLEARGYREVAWDDADLYPAGGFRVGDVVLSSGEEGGVGHVAMVVADGPLLAEAWIAEDGSTSGGRGDSTGQETRVAPYGDHPDTTAGAWTSCHRFDPATFAAQHPDCVEGGAPDPAPSTPAPPAGRPGPLLGIDISNWQAGINLGAVNPDFTIVMATQGDWFTNRCFAEQVDAALALGRPTGVYHYVDGSGVEAEADHFLAVVGDRIGRVFWAVDWEAKDNGAWGDEGYLRAVVDAIKARTGRRGLLYASSDAYPDAVQAATGSMRWVAQYADSDPTGWDKSPWSDGSWTADMHQYTGTGRVPGYDGNLDLNLFRGGEDDLWALAGKAVQGPAADDIYILEGNDMRVTHILFAYKGTMYLYCVLANTYTPIPNEATLKDIKFILARAGAKVEDWLEFNRGSSLEVGNLMAFGHYQPLDG